MREPKPKPLSEVLKAISPLPWKARYNIVDSVLDAAANCFSESRTEDAAYIAHAANTLPEIIAELRKLSLDLSIIRAASRNQRVEWVISIKNIRHLELWLDKLIAHGESVPQ